MWAALFAVAALSLLIFSALAAIATYLYFFGSSDSARKGFPSVAPDEAHHSSPRAADAGAKRLSDDGARCGRWGRPVGARSGRIRRGKMNGHAPLDPLAQPPGPFGWKVALDKTRAPDCGHATPRRLPSAWARSRAGIGKLVDHVAAYSDSVNTKLGSGLTT